MAEEEKKEEGAVEEVAAEAPSGGGSKLVMILTIVNIVATLGIGGVLFMSFQKEKSRPGVQDIAATDEHGEKKEEGGHGEAAAGGEHGGGGHGEAGKPTGPAKNAPRMVKLEQFTINLSTPGSATPKFVRASISVEVPNEDSEKEVSNKMPQVRNSIIDLFNAKRPADLATAEGRDYLKEEIINALNTFLITGKVKGVYFTSFALSG